MARQVSSSLLPMAIGAGNSVLKLKRAGTLESAAK